jgi:hypothetical protein
MQTLSSTQYEISFAANGSAVLALKFAVVSDASGVAYDRINTESAIVRPSVARQLLRGLVRNAEIPLSQIVDSPQWVFDMVQDLVSNPTVYDRRNRQVLDLWNIKFQIAAL